MPVYYRCHAAKEFPGWDQVPKTSIHWTTGLNIGSASEIHGLITTPELPITAQLLERMHQLVVISAYGVGYDYIDVEAASTLGILVTHTPNAVIRATTELGVALILASIRDIVGQDRRIRRKLTPSGKLEFPVSRLTHDASSQLVGLVGYGRIGQHLGQVLMALDIPFIYTRRRGPLTNHPGYRDLDVMLEEADVIVLTVPLTPGTYHLINRQTLSHMKPTAILINIARGACVDEVALIEALQSGTIAGAALDVFEDEPWVPKALGEMDNVILSPHAGTSTWETRLAMTRDAVGNVLSALAGVPQNALNSDQWTRIANRKNWQC